MNCSLNAVEHVSVIERSLSNLRAQLLAQLHIGDTKPDPSSLLNLAQDLSGQIYALDDRIAFEATCRLVDSIATYFAAETGATFSDLHNSLDQLATIEERLLQFQGDISPDVSDIDELIERSIASPISKPNFEQTKLPSTENIDRELLDVFREEAEDLLRNFGACLNALAADTWNETALWEIRRHAHTFKGSAAIVGFLHLSKLAHTVEDFIEAFANQQEHGRLGSLTKLRDSIEGLRSAAVVALTESNFGPDDYSNSDPQNTKPQKTKHYMSAPPTADLSPTVKIEKAPTTHKETEPLNNDAKETILRMPSSKLDRLDREMLELELSRRDAERESKQITLKNERLVTKLTEFFGKTPDRTREADQVSELHELAVEIGIDLRTVQQRWTSAAPRASSMRTQMDQLRTVEFGTIKGRLERTARVTAEETDKNVALKLDNESALIDAHILARLTEPLLHLIRNAVVHGVESPDTRRFLGKNETGTISVSYLRSETHIDVVVRDDGSGIDQARLLKKASEIGIAPDDYLKRLSDSELHSLIFQVGLSTADSLTVNAGRGVGMSIVKRGVDSLGGAIRLNSISQSGTEFRLRIPLLKPTVNVGLYRSGTTVFAIPAEQMVPTAQNRKQITRQFQIVEFKADNNIGRVFVDEIIGAAELLSDCRKKGAQPTPGILGYGFETADSPIPIINVDHVFEHGLPFPIASDNLENKKKLVEARTVLVVDDSPSARSQNVKILRRRGFNVVAVSEGIEALNWLAKFEVPPVLLVTDIEMPEMDGFELIKAVRKIENHLSLPIIIVSSCDDAAQQLIANQLGVTALLKKPVNDAELIAAVDASVVGI